MSSIRSEAWIVEAIERGSFYFIYLQQEPSQVGLAEILSLCMPAVLELKDPSVSAYRVLGLHAWTTSQQTLSFIRSLDWNSI